MTSLKFEKISRQLPSLNTPIAVPDKNDHLKASAVLIILHLIENHWHLLLTKRADHLKHHAGQISFPGGRYEQIDQHLAATAIRETEEEVGIDNALPQLISQLENHPTLTGFRIYPFIAIVEKLPELIIDQREVEEVFSVPLDFLMDQNNQQLESVVYNQQQFDVYKIVWRDKTIWGATARMIVELAEYIK